ncbi:spore germination protein [Paenibacillus soyae]|uniref:Spore germination protein n=1 Tax=Paenibacillus soyae TaxID=2969249 RepID=A0A9X2MPD0_9BACL|nr:spore germination protein [Paenibacillus soyae]MCR2803759.1 spore germination protein [Paenibacillus soyae]
MRMIKELEARSETDSDLLFQHIRLAGQPTIFIAFRSLIDLPATLNDLYQRAAWVADQPERGSLGEEITEPEEEALLALLLGGQALLWHENGNRFASLTPIAKSLSRSIESPTTENVLRGSISAFVEDIDTNIGLIRKHEPSGSLHTRDFRLGSSGQKRVSFLYKEGVIDAKLKESITQRLVQNAERDAGDLQQLASLLGFPRWTLVTKFNTSELPQEAETALNEGKAVLLLERMPFAIILPSLMWDMFAVQNDRNFPAIFMMLIRFLRMLAVLTNIIIPGLYVALVSVNPDVLRIEMALTIAKSRVDVPYPSLVETLLLLFILELTLEASIRLPKSIGPTVTMVGGIILGQAVVSAKLVSNLLIIILAATSISSSVVVGFQNSFSIRLFKYLLLVLSAMYGVIGLVAGLVVICAYLASVTSFGIPYLELYKPGRKSNG